MQRAGARPFNRKRTTGTRDDRPRTMLFTRCPHCRTTFRIKTEALEKAGGHVRCGRCSNIFNAHDALHEGLPESDANAAPNPAADEQVIAVESAPEARGSETSAADGGSDSAPQAHGQEDVAAESGDDETATHASSADGDSSAATAQTPANDEWVARVLEQDAVQEPSEQPAWSQMQASATPGRRSALWAAGSVLALFALFAQGVNHFRDDLAARPQVGALLQRTYGLFGLQLAPDWNVHQYRVLKWTATAEPKTKVSGKSALVITAKIQNRGPLAQPYPYIHLRLKNRFEDVVGSRTFQPSEYLAKKPVSDALMSPGAVADARLAVVDPGPDAYGFDLDVCVKGEHARFHCADDDVFK